MILPLLNKWCYNNSGCLPFTKKIRKFRLQCKWKTNPVFPNGKFPGKIRFLERWTKISKLNFRTEIVHSICSFWPVPGLSDWIPWNCKWNSKSRMEIPIRVLMLSIYHTCWPTSIIQMPNCWLTRCSHPFFYYDTLPRYHGRPANKTPLN